MKYITHNRFKKLAACGEAVNIPYGTEMETAGDFIITTEGKPLCYATSEAAKMHFARNDDRARAGTREADLGHRVLPAGADRPERTAAALHRGGDRAAGTEVGTFPAAGCGGHSVQRRLFLRRRCRS